MLYNNQHRLQELFTCIRPADWSSDCSDSGKFVGLNRQFGASPVADEDDSVVPAAPVAAAADETPVVAIETKQQPNINVAVAVKAPADVVPIHVRPTASAAPDHRVVVADIAADEQKVVASLKSILQAVDEKNAVPVPVYDDAETSETQSFGLFKVVDDNDTAVGSLTEVAQDNATDAAPVEHIVEIESVAPSQSENDVAPEVVAVTETSALAVAAAEEESTELWNHLVTQSLYDGGSTVGDNVEVNAILDGDAQVVTEAIHA